MGCENSEFYKWLLQLSGVKSLYDDESNDSIEETAKPIHRILYILLIKNTNDEIVDEALTKLRLTKEIISKYFNYDYPAEPEKEFSSYAADYQNERIIGQVVKYRGLSRLQKLSNMILEKKFVEGTLMSDGNNKNAVEYAIYEKKIDVIKFLMSFNEIKQEYVSNKGLLWRCIYWINERYDESVASYLMKELDLTEDKLKDLQTYQFVKYDTDQKESYYFDKSITDEMISKLLKLTK